MPIDDRKKCQTYINICGQQVLELKDIATRLEAVRSAYVAQSVDPTGTPMDGYESAVSTWINNVRGVADAAVPNGLLAGVIPTHQNNALGEL